MAPKPRLPKFNFDNNYKTEYISHSDGSRDEIFIPPYIWQGRLDNTKKNTKHTGKMYQFIKKLGNGSFGYVVLYQNKETGHQLAVKFLTSYSDFEAEASNYQKLAKSNCQKYLPQFYGIIDGKSKGIVLEVLNKDVIEYFEGTNNRFEKIAPRQVWSHCKRLVRMVKCIQDKGICINDFKTDNLMMKDDVLYLVDLCLSGNVPFSKICHTDMFDPPEPFGRHTNRDCHKKRDIWNLAIVLYLLTVRKLWPSLNLSLSHSQRKKIIKNPMSSEEIKKEIMSSRHLNNSQKKWVVGLLVPMFQVDPAKRASIGDVNRYISTKESSGVWKKTQTKKNKKTNKS